MRQANSNWYKIRWIVLERDKFTCRYCGQFAPNVKLEVDHRIAVVDHGTDDLDNLVTACYACNHGKEAYRASLIPKRQIKSTKDTIMDYLIENGPSSATDLARATGLTRGSVAKFFGRRHDLLEFVQKDGRNALYRAR